MWQIESIFRGSVHLCYTYISIPFYSAAALSFEFNYLLFPLNSIASGSDFLVVYSISDMWYIDSFWVIFTSMPLSLW